VTQARSASKAARRLFSASQGLREIITTPKKCSHKGAESQRLRNLRTRRRRRREVGRRIIGCPHRLKRQARIASDATACSQALRLCASVRVLREKYRIGRRVGRVNAILRQTAELLDALARTRDAMIDFEYLPRGLSAMARAQRVWRMAGHLGAAFAAGYYIGEQHPDLDDRVHAGIRGELYAAQSSCGPGRRRGPRFNRPTAVSVFTHG
jgi:hypothetical protein